MLKTVSSIANAIGALNYKGTWNASTNTPALASGTGSKGDYYQVSVSGSTNLDGLSNWGVGDIAAFNGTTWQRIEGGADLNGVNLNVSNIAIIDENLFVGVSTGSGNNEAINVSGSSTSFIAYVDNTSTGTRRGILSTYSGSSPPNDTGNEFIFCNDITALRMSVRSNGGIANFAANNVILSDRREKTNFAPAKSYLETICAIPVQTFNYIDQNMEEDDGLTLGVVAQDVQAIAPELVTEGNWGTKENPKMRLEIYQTDLQYALMKCIQEQQALIQTLTARITALEGA